MIAQCARKSALPAPVCSGCSVWSTLRYSVFFSSRLDWILRRDLAVWSCSCDALRHLGRPLPGPGLAGPKPSQPAGMRPRLRSNFRVAPVRSTPRTADDTTQQSRGFEQTRQSVTVYGYCCVFSRAAVNINGGHFRHLPPHCTHCGWAQFASFAVRSVRPAATARWRCAVVDVLVEVGSWLCTCQFLRSALALRSGLHQPTPFS